MCTLWFHCLSEISHISVLQSRYHFDSRSDAEIGEVGNIILVICHRKKNALTDFSLFFFLMKQQNVVSEDLLL